MDALAAIRDNGHTAALSDELLAEWTTHASRWATLWLTEMISANRTAEYDTSKLPDRPAWRRRVLDTARDNREASAIHKDMFLLELARLSDNCVLSKDDIARLLFTQAAGLVHDIGPIMWVNPCPDATWFVQWLQSGMPLERSKMLRP